MMFHVYVYMYQIPTMNVNSIHRKHEQCILMLLMLLMLMMKVGKGDIEMEG